MITRSNNRHAKPAHKEHKYSMGVCCRIKLLVIISLPKFHSCNFPKHVSQIHTVQVPPTLETYRIQGNTTKLGICRINSYSNISSHKTTVRICFDTSPYMRRYHNSVENLITANTHASHMNTTITKTYTVRWSMHDITTTTNLEPAVCVWCPKPRWSFTQGTIHISIKQT